MNSRLVVLLLLAQLGIVAECGRVYEFVRFGAEKVEGFFVDDRVFFAGTAFWFWLWLWLWLWFY